MIGPTLKPTSFGLAGNYSNISQYKKAINDAIDKRINEFNAVHYNYAPYLKFLVILFLIYTTIWSIIILKADEHHLSFDLFVLG